MAYVGMGGWWDDFLAYNSPSAWGTVAADAYQKIQYGDIPAPGAGLPLPPAPAAPAPAQAAGWNPDLLAAESAALLEQWKADARAAILQAELDGSYVPAGRLPFTAEDASAALDWSGKYGGWILAGGLGLVVLVLMRGGR